MLRKLLFSCLLISSFSYGQFNQDAPWMQNIKTKSNQTSKTESISIDDISKAFNEYWLDKDYKKKGSGYKPYKRWENYWNYFANSNGVIPSSKELYQSWKNKVAGTGKVNEISNWTSIGPVNTSPFSGRLPGQGRVNAIAVDPNNSNIWYVGAPAGGIWKSTNSGSSWVNLFDDFPQIGVSGIAIDPNNSDIIYIATGDDDAADSYSIGVYKSNDGGLTWNETGLNPSNTTINFLANEIVIDPNDSNILWLGTNSGLMKSTNGGASWSVKQSGNIKDFKLKPGDSNTIYAVSSNRYFKSIDGNTFSAITSTLPESSGRLVLGTSIANPEVLYILSANTSANGYSFQGIYKSIDSGTTFIKSNNTTNILESNQAWFDLALEVSPSNSNMLFVGCLNIWTSSNGGNSFSQINQWFSNNNSYTHADIHTLKFFNNKLFCGSDGGIYVSENNGNTFLDKTSNMAISQFYRISVAKGNAGKIIGGLQDNGGQSLNNGQWKNYHGGDGMDNVIDPMNENIIYGFTQYGGSLNISTNSGQSIGSIGPPLNTAGDEIEGNWITPLAIGSDGEVYSGFDYVYKLVGNSWQRLSNKFGSGNIDDLEVDPNNPMVLYAAENDFIYKSIDGGLNFVAINRFDSQVSSFTVSNSDPNTLYVTTSNRVGIAQANQPSVRGVFKLIINGNNAVEEDITYNLPTDQAYFSIAHQGRHTDNPIYVGTSLGVYRLDDTLTEWEEYYTNLPSTAVSDIDISLDDEIITVSTYGRGIWQSPIPIQVPDNDIRLISISPRIGNVLCGEIQPVVTVENTGSNQISQIDINYSINNGSTENFIWNGNLLSNQTTAINLPIIEGALVGEIELAVTVDIINDAYPDNNSARNIFYQNSFGIGDQLFTFESENTSLLNYTESGDEEVWQRGIPTGTLLNSASSGTQVLATNLSGNHQDNVRAVILSNCYELSSILAPVLKFKMAYDLEVNFDIVYVEYSINNGETWSILGNINSQPLWYNSNRTNSDGTQDDCQNCPGAQWTGTNPVMTEYAYDFNVNAANGETDLTSENNILFRIVFQSDEAVNQEGVIIDDFIIEGIQDDDDDDNDGILDINDNCPLISNSSQLDTDGDGIGNACDMDDDGDGILDINDNCPLTSNTDQADIDNDGIGDVCDTDADNDGVSNIADICPETPLGSVVDINGCVVFTLPVTNFKVLITSESCILSNNGSVSITADTPLNYTATITGNTINTNSTFTTSTTFNDLSAGSYNICITVEGQPNYIKCYDINITEPLALSVFSAIGSLNKEVTLYLSGAKKYFITLNGMSYETESSTITIPLMDIKNTLLVKTDKDCQGIYKESIYLSEEIIIYPNPISGGDLNILFDQNNLSDLSLSLYSINGTKIFTKDYANTNKSISFNVDSLSKGIYLLNIKTNNSLTRYKIIRK